MNPDVNELELTERLKLIEKMISEGRRTTEGWGWTFLLWGTAYYVAIGWSAWVPKSSLPWPVTMISAFVITWLLAATRSRRHPETTLGRAIASVWIATGISMFVLFMTLTLKGWFETQIYMSVIAAMLGTANATSALILKWKPQFVCTLVWWLACCACVVGSERQALIVLLAAIFVCQFVFGAYMMICESRRQRGAVHA